LLNQITLQIHLIKLDDETEHYFMKKFIRERELVEQFDQYCKEKINADSNQKINGDSNQKTKYLPSGWIAGRIVNNHDD